MDPNVAAESGLNPPSGAPIVPAAADVRGLLGEIAEPTNAKDEAIQNRLIQRRLGIGASLFLCTESSRPGDGRSFAPSRHLLLVLGSKCQLQGGSPNVAGDLGTPPRRWQTVRARPRAAQAGKPRRSTKRSTRLTKRTPPKSRSCCPRVKTSPKARSRPYRFSTNSNPWSSRCSRKSPASRVRLHLIVREAR
jgi:hypothetical protein